MAWLSPAIREKVAEMLEKHFPYPQSHFAKEHYGKGIIEGEQQGEAALLLRQLGRRFGELPAEVKERVCHAKSETLLRWGERVLDADTLEAVFADD